MCKKYMMIFDSCVKRNGEEPTVRVFFMCTERVGRDIAHRCMSVCMLRCLECTTIHRAFSIYISTRQNSHGKSLFCKRDYSTYPNRILACMHQRACVWLVNITAVLVVQYMHARGV
jgi:hypothetical protein